MLYLQSYVYIWSLVISAIALFFLWSFVYSYIFGPFVFLITLFPFPQSEFSLSLNIDCYSTLFSFIVLLISLVVFVFSITYFQSFQNGVYFFWITFFFVLSMLILINFSDLFIVILGWDGLGVVSFFLIVFYQSQVSIFSGVFTILINRLGDCLFIILIVIFSFTSPFLGFFWYLENSYTTFLVIFVCFMTNSAIFPFSPWLPAAIAAPTPISSLVHSSTLVTAGLYLIIRHSNVVYSFESIGLLLVILGVFTSFYAGCSSLFESDLNNVVALSTLSHLGFICLALGLGWEILAFFHLLTHALFNSSLFMAVGSLIAENYHYQDSRYFSFFSSSAPYSTSIIFISEGSLVGFSFFSGFYSNDYVLEAFHYSSFCFLLYCFLLLNLFFTFVYSFRILNSLVCFYFGNSYNLFINFDFYHMFFLSFLSLLSIVAGKFIVSLWDFSLLTIPSGLNVIPPLLLFLFFTFFYLIQNNFILSHIWAHPMILYFFSNIVFLVDFFTNFLSNVLFSSISFNNHFEAGGFSFFIFSWSSWFLSVFSRYILYLFSLNLFYCLILGLALFCFITF